VWPVFSGCRTQLALSRTCLPLSVREVPGGGSGTRPSSCGVPAVRPGRPATSHTADRHPTITPAAAQPELFPGIVTTPRERFPPPLNLRNFREVVPVFQSFYRVRQ